MNTGSFALEYRDAKVIPVLLHQRCARPPTEPFLGHPQELIPEQLSYLAWALTGSPLGPFSPGAPLRPASPCNDSDWGTRENDNDAEAWGS